MICKRDQTRLQVFSVLRMRVSFKTTYDDLTVRLTLKSNTSLSLHHQYWDDETEHKLVCKLPSTERILQMIYFCLSTNLQYSFSVKICRLVPTS